MILNILLINCLKNGIHYSFLQQFLTGLKDIMNRFLIILYISVKTRQSAENVNQDIIKVGQTNKIEVLT